MKRRTIIFLVLLAVLFLFTTYIQKYKECEVKEVIDGDTFTTTDGRTVRLIGINAPELGDPYSYDAKDKLEDLIIGKKIRLESDAGDKDVYGRILRYVYVDNLFVNREMVRLGLAVTEEIKPNIMYSSAFLEAENMARDARRCVWST